MSAIPFYRNFLMARRPVGHQSSWVKTFFRRLFWFVVILAVLFFGAWGFENWRGGSEWQQAKERAARMGVSLDLADYATEEIPEGECLMEDPVFLAEWNGEIEPELGRISSMKLEGVKTRGIKSGSIPKGEAMDYRQYFEDEMSEAEAVRKLDKIYQPVAARLKNLGKIILEKPNQDIRAPSDDFLESGEILRLLKTVNALREYSRLSLRKGNSQEAVWAYEVIVRLGQNSSEPALINLLVSNAAEGTVDKIIWDGIWLHEWNKKDLDRIVAHIPSDPDYNSLGKALRYEAAIASPFVDQVEEQQRTILENIDAADPPSFEDRVIHWTAFQGPSGWKNWRKATILNASLDLLEQRSDWEILGKESATSLQKLSTFEESRFHPLNWIRTMQIGEANWLEKLLKRSTRSRLTRIAIELERYRLQKRRYPKSLDEMELTFSIEDLTDPKERDLKYEKTDDGYFQLWSEFEREGEKRPDLEWKFPETGKQK